MRCLVCSSNDWENVDWARYKPEGMSICKTCGFVSYPSKWKSKEEIFEHYRKDYRPPPTFNNLCTGTRKIHFHKFFLQDVFKEWKSKGLDKPKVFEVGAAYGMALAFIRDAYKGADVSGSELTVTYRKNAKYEYGIELQEEFDDRKCDLIMSYKVAEHQLDADLELTRYANALNPGGYLYISVPTWFDSMCNFGQTGFDPNYYYDTNHVNVWTQKLFENVLWNAGFKIIKKDYKMYDSTYLCQVHGCKVMQKKDYESHEDIKEKLKKIKQAYELFNANKFDEAINIWPDYPSAHVSRFEMNRKQFWEQFKAKGWDFVKENVIDFAINSCPNSSEIDALAVDVAMRFEKFHEAIKYAEAGLKSKPENPVFLMQLINIMRELMIRGNDEKAKAHYANQAREISAHLRNVSPEHLRQATDMKYLFNAELPL